eukprot:TRINITY_DN18782_c0_g1_i1.p1 TRINITY_DN18782_c0_g1~~TRINITY_DN18782_c0_g1_i1.p1  ORF type:complete len:323 (-),score=41.55 TRINITY_DN18782_c0_g1_i1:151-1119(-)
MVLMDLAVNAYFGPSGSKRKHPLVQLWTRDQELGNVVRVRTGANLQSQPNDVLAVLRQESRAFCTAARHWLSSEGIADLIRKNDTRSSNVLRSLAKYDSWSELATHPVGSQWLLKCMRFGHSRLLEARYGLLSSLVKAWPELACDPHGAAILAAAHPFLERDSVDRLWKKYKEGMFELARDKHGSVVVKVLIKTLLHPDQSQSPAELGKVCFRDQWAEACIHPSAHKIVCSFVPSMHSTIVAACSAEFGDNWPVVLANDPHGVHVVHALLWEPETALKTQQLHDWVLSWQQRPEGREEGISGQARLIRSLRSKAAHEKHAFS